MDQDPNESPRESVHDAARELKGEAEATIGQIRSRGIWGFFNFECMYFPLIARYLFIIMAILTVLGMVLGVLSGLAAMVSTSVISGLRVIVTCIVGGLLSIVVTRITFEMVLLGFKVYESVQEINRKMRG